MAVSPEAALSDSVTPGNPVTPGSGNLMGFNTSSLLTKRILLGLGLAAVAAVMVVLWLWSQQPVYRVLFSNYADKDGGAIVAVLEQMNVPYKFSDSGAAILVPSTQVDELRLKLAAQGLPRGGNIGFELLENQKFGVSQFVEQVNFQRALEGELERSIQSISAVEIARIHLAIPKSSVFVRDQLKPTASVLLNLRPGRVLDQQQVSAIVHLVASSVPELNAADVTVVDQNGNLLSDSSKKAGNNLDPSQLKYVDELQQNIVKRVESIIAPIVGSKNVHAEASAEVDFSVQEQAAELYKPNQTPDAAAIRSMQSNESKTTDTNANGGVPGALSNQPPVPATAPLVTNPPPNAAAGTNPAATGANTTGANTTGTNTSTTTSEPVPVSTQKNVTTNYEVDKTVRYTQQPMGGVKRLSVAIVVNHLQSIDAKGKVSSRALTDDEKTQISDLAKQAMGFNAERGDTLTVVNSSFVADAPEVLPEIPLWKQPENIEMAKEFLKIGIAVAAIILLYLRVMKPMLRKLSPEPPAQLTATEDEDAIADEDTIVTLDANPQLEARQPTVRAYEKDLEAAKQLAKDNPKLVANLVTEWVSSNE